LTTNSYLTILREQDMQPASVGTNYSWTSGIPEMSAQIILGLPEPRKCQHKLFLDFRSSGNISTNYSRTFGVPEVSAQNILKRQNWKGYCIISQEKE